MLSVPDTRRRVFPKEVCSTAYGDNGNQTSISLSVSALLGRTGMNLRYSIEYIHFIAVDFLCAEEHEESSKPVESARRVILSLCKEALVPFEVLWLYYLIELRTLAGSRRLPNARRLYMVLRLGVCMYFQNNARKGAMALKAFSSCYIPLTLRDQLRKNDCLTHRTAQKRAYEYGLWD